MSLQRPFATIIVLALVAPLAVSGSSGLEVTKARELWDQRQETVFTLPSSQPLAAAVDLSIFGAFEPGLTLEAAAERFGAPKLLLEGAYYDHWRYARYETPRSFVEVAYEPGGDTCGTHHRRTLYAYPKGQAWPLGEVLPGITETSLSVQPARVLVIGGVGDERVWCLVKGGRVHAVNWHRANANGT